VNEINKTLHGSREGVGGDAVLKKELNESEAEPDEARCGNAWPQ
jgi:hypothetical protein